MKNISLHKKAFATGAWQKHGNLFFAGYAFFKDELIEPSFLVNKIEKAENSEGFKQIVNALNGCFAIVYQDSKKTCAAVDPCRSIPLFYSESWISDSLEVFYQDLSFNESKLGRLANLEFVQGSQTFFDSWKQLQAGEFLWQQSNDVKIETYFSHFRTDIEEGLETLKTEFSSIINQMSKRLISSLQGKTALVPLSGGFDSRFILAMLVKQKYTNIICFTYGNESAFEVEIAQKVCAKIGVKWILVPYNQQTFENCNFELFEGYLKFGSNGVSVPQEQEFFALDYLSTKGFLPKDAVFLPGFCADVQAGSFIPDVFFESKWKKNPISSAQYIAKKLSRSLHVNQIKSSNTPTKSFYQFYAEVEEWVLREREAKYVINGVRCYEFFGFEWRLPLWDKDFISFWQKVPMRYRRDKKLYIETLNQELFNDLNITIIPKNFDSRFKSKSVATKLRYILPESVKKMAKKLLIPKQEHEVNNLNYFSILLQQRLGYPKPDIKTEVNEMMGLYLKSLLEFEREGE